MSHEPPETVDDLATRAYDQLRRIATRFFNNQAPGQTLQPTALVHEAFVRLATQSPEAFADKSHFVSVAARAMRQILVDRARRRNADKRGGGRQQVTLSGIPGEAGGSEVEVLALDDALKQLAESNPREAHVVELRFFGGLSVPEVARVTGSSAARARLASGSPRGG